MSVTSYASKTSVLIAGTGEVTKEQTHQVNDVTKIRYGAVQEVDPSTLVRGQNHSRWSSRVAGLAYLKASIKEKGQLQSVIVTPIPVSRQEYYLATVCGNHRVAAIEALRAEEIAEGKAPSWKVRVEVRDYRRRNEDGTVVMSAETGLPEIDYDRMMSDNITENAAREGLNDIDRAYTCARLADLGLTQEQIAKRLGIQKNGQPFSQAQVSNLIKLTKLIEPLQTLVAQEVITTLQGFKLADQTPEKQEELLNAMLGKGSQVELKFEELNRTIAKKAIEAVIPGDGYKPGSLYRWAANGKQGDVPNYRLQLALAMAMFEKNGDHRVENTITFEAALDRIVPGWRSLHASTADVQAFEDKKTRGRKAGNVVTPVPSATTTTPETTPEPNSK